jgi:glycosyltransferase involved in cell wall biosynthesis
LQATNRIKVLYIQVPPGGGSLIALYEMLRNIDHTVIEPVVLCYCRSGYTQMLEGLPYGKVIYLNQSFETKPAAKVIARRQTQLHKLWRLITAEYTVVKNYYFSGKAELNNIRSIIQKIAPGIVHHNNDILVNRNAVRACIRAGIPQIIHNRAIPVYKRWSFNYVIDAFLLKKINYTINITRAVSDNYNRIFSRGKKKELVIHDLVDTKKFSPSPASASLMNEFALSGSDFIIANIGRIINWKGQHVFIEALNMLKEKAPNIKTLIVGPYDDGVGSEDYLHYLQSLVKKYNLSGTVIFTGNRDDIPAIINTCQAVVHTAIKPEPQGLILIEALLCKKMVIASNGGGAAEIINKYGGTLVTPGNAHALADAILSCITSPNRHNGDASVKYNRLLEDFDSTQQMKKILHVYQSLLNPEPSFKKTHDA